jgi:hypothetical protein
MEKTMKPVKLQDIVDALDTQSEVNHIYLDRRTGQIVQLCEEAYSCAEQDASDDGDQPDWMQEDIRKARELLSDDQGNFLELPTRYDIHEYSIMEQFARDYPDKKKSARMERALQGKGAFRYFHDTVDELGVMEEWLTCRRKALAEIAVEWCEANKIMLEKKD